MACRLHSTCLLCVLNDLYKPLEKTLLSLFVRNLLTGHLSKFVSIRPFHEHMYRCVVLGPLPSAEKPRYSPFRQRYVSNYNIPLQSQEHPLILLAKRGEHSKPRYTLGVLKAPLNLGSMICIASSIIPCTISPAGFLSFPKSTTSPTMSSTPSQSPHP